jgi:hypothetical protein
VSRQAAVRIAAALVVALALLVATGSIRGAIERPAYTVGDRWIYDLRGQLEGLPGLDGSGFGTFTVSLVGRVEVEIVGLPLVGGTTYTDVSTVTTGFLNATFTIPGTSLTGTVTGTLDAVSMERWEPQGYLPIASNVTTTYDADVTALVSTDLIVETQVNATSTITINEDVFPLDVGNVTTASFATDVVARTTFSFLGNTTSFENSTSLVSEWRREVLAQGTVSAPAGTFGAYRVNQTLTSFPGFGGVAGSEVGNETAYYSNDTGNYVVRTAYVNGTEVGDLRLRSYVYAARAPPGLSPLTIVLIVGVPAGLALIGIAWAWKRRRRRRPRGLPDAR